MLGLTPDPLSAGVGMHVAVAGPYTSTKRVTAWQDGADAQRKEYPSGVRFVGPNTRAGRRPRQPVANDRLRHVRIGSARVSKPPEAALCHRRASDAVVISTIRSNCSRLERPLPGGIRTR